jgi:predicted MFS family arabinose efflux permease
VVIFTLGNSSDAFLLVRASELGVPTAMLPLLWFVFHVVKSIGNVLGGGLADRYGARRPLLVGWLLYAVVYIAFGLATTAWHVWGLFLIYAVFYSLTEPAEKSLVANLTGSDRRGLAFGWYNFAIGIAALPSSLVFGSLYEEFGPLMAFGWGAALALVATCLLMVTGKDGDSAT